MTSPTTIAAGHNPLRDPDDRRLPRIARALLAGGRTPGTPVALVRWGTTDAQEMLVGRLDEIAELAAAAALSPPVVIVVGDVVALRERLAWLTHQSGAGEASSAEAAEVVDSVAIRASADLVPGEEDQAVLADLDLVAVGQLDGVDAVPVDVGAVERPHVGDREGLALAVELRVPPRHGHVVEEDLAVRVPARAYDVLVEEEP